MRCNDCGEQFKEVDMIIDYLHADWTPVFICAECHEKKKEQVEKYYDSVRKQWDYSK